jgi:transmembrane sensor
MIPSQTPSRIPAGADDAAAFWSARRRLGLMTARDQAAFEAWRADPAHAAAFAAADGVVEEAGEVAALAAVRQMREAALAVRPAAPRWRAASIAAAAVVMAGLGAGFIALRAYEPTPPAPLAAEPGAARRYATKVGERTEIRLEDGSRVALNTATVLEVAYTAGRRDVRLLQGQALFTVAKNPRRPFIVTAADRRVTAVGTAFDVRLNRGQVDVVLIEGRVTVEPVRPQGLQKLLPAIARDTLDAGELLVADQADKVTVSAADVERATSWRRGQVIFRDDTIADAVAEMNRYGETQLVIEDPRIADLRISGVFATSRDANFIAALTAFYPIAAERRSSLVTALTWREGARL